MAPDHSGLLSMATSRQILNVAKEAYPAVVLGIFLICFITYGVVTAPDDSDKVKVHPMRGPGGRPLPARRQSANQIKEAARVRDFSPSAKLIFRMLTLGVLVTFVGNAASIILQTIIYRRQEWWPGQAAVVSSDIPFVCRSWLMSSDLCNGFIFCLGRGPNLTDRHQASANLCSPADMVGCSPYRLARHWDEPSDLHFQAS